MSGLILETDKRANAAYISFGKGREIAKTIEATHNINIDYDERGAIVGIELLDACWLLPEGMLP